MRNISRLPQNGSVYLLYDDNFLSSLRSFEMIDKISYKTFINVSDQTINGTIVPAVES